MGFRRGLCGLGVAGTSMAAPFVSGSLALMIDAWQQGGTSWSFGSNAQPLFMKMLLLASATELNGSREQGVTNSPTLGRAATPKDRFEGYGMRIGDVHGVQSGVMHRVGSVPQRGYLRHIDGGLLEPRQGRRHEL